MSIHDVSDILEISNDGEKRGARQERERILALIAEELNEWSDVFLGQQNYRDGAKQASISLRKRITKGKK